jgi:hypothetical protein
MSKSNQSFPLLSIKVKNMQALPAWLWKVGAPKTTLNMKPTMYTTHRKFGHLKYHVAFANFHHYIEPIVLMRFYDYDEYLKAAHF